MSEPMVRKSNGCKHEPAATYNCLLCFRAEVRRLRAENAGLSERGEALAIALNDLASRVPSWSQGKQIADKALAAWRSGR